jgi:16S rRNA (guanine966-N2)-methyltransferase
MRIIAGLYRSRTLEAPAGMATRPTSDRLRETLFNVLAPRIEGALFLDLYAGSGAVGIEALSRGAAGVEFVERAPGALGALRKNLERLGIEAGFRLHGAGVGGVLRKMGPGAGGTATGEGLRFPAHSQRTRKDGARGISGSISRGSLEQPPSAGFDVVFLDPPYDAAAEYAATLGLLGGAAVGLLTDGAVVIAEHRKKERLEESYGMLARTRLLEQGDAALSFYAVRAASAAE